jgi:two-component system nitrogen regulation sensor histidine kinase GlnL
MELATSWLDRNRPSTTKKAMNQVRKSPRQNHKLAEHLLSSLTTAVIVLDKNLRVTRLNSAAEDLLHVSAGSVIASPLTNLLLRAEDLVKSLHQAIENTQPFTARNVQLQLPESTVENVDLTVSNLETPKGLLLELHATSRINSISQGSLSEEQQITTRSLIRGLAHEVKNPLGGIRGAAQLLERALPTEDLKEYTNIIISESDRLRDLVDRMLGPWQPMQLTPINLIEIIERVMQILQGEFVTNLQWSRDYDPSLPEVHGNQDQLIQAILNVARNACEALHGTERARITFKTRVVRQFTIGAVRHKQVMHLSIIDNGPGVPEDLIERIFFPMISGRPEGSGLGLSISQNIIGQHGGALQVASRPGHTVFSVYLPFSQPNQPPP